MVIYTKGENGMRRVEREITDIAQIERILSQEQVCRLALMDEEYPYIIPMIFGYDLDGDRLELYFHTAAKGRKLDIIKANNRAAFEIDRLLGIQAGDTACSYTAHYECITGTGTIDIINGIDKITGLNRITHKYINSPTEGKFSEQMLNNVVILKLTADEFSCKANYPKTAE